MLHTIKNLSLCAMFAIVAMTFAACSSDDDRDNPIVQQLIGSWQPISNCSSCGQSNTFETWYKDLTWDKHTIVDGNTELVRKCDDCQRKSVSNENSALFSALKHSLIGKPL